MLLLLWASKKILRWWQYNAVAVVSKHEQARQLTMTMTEQTATMARETKAYNYIYVWADRGPDDRRHELLAWVTNGARGDQQVWHVVINKSLAHGDQQVWHMWPREAMDRRRDDRQIWNMWSTTAQDGGNDQGAVTMTLVCLFYLRK